MDEGVGNKMRGSRKLRGIFDGINGMDGMGKDKGSFAQRTEEG
jgi:hypothetical protein